VSLIAFSHLLLEELIFALSMNADVASPTPSVPGRKVSGGTITPKTGNYLAIPLTGAVKGISPRVQHRSRV
jgi:hypothetical protein